MGYEIHIERDDGRDIGLEEWCAAAAHTEGLRLAQADYCAVNPKTGERIVIAANEGDVEVFLPELDAWIPCLQWSSGQVFFRASPEFNDGDSPFRRTVVAIAKQLDAKLVGDDVEVYY